MSSNRKSAASRRNSCKSCGPRTAAGKAIASRNALRHGLSAVAHQQPDSSTEIQRFAQAICGQNETSALLEQARAIVTNELVLRSVNVQKIAVVERLREPTAIALAKGDNSMELATARFMRAWLAHRELETLIPQVLKKYEDQMPPLTENNERRVNEFTQQEIGIVPLRIKALLDEVNDSDLEQKDAAVELARKLVEEQHRDKYEALEAAAADLIRLERYERRAWSRQKRAIRSFMNLKMMTPVSQS